MPASFRWVTLAAVILGFQVSFVALSQLDEARHPERTSPLEKTPAEFSRGLDLTPELSKELGVALGAGQRGALVGLQPWRSATLVLLAGACGVVFFLGMRLRMGARNRARTALWLSRAAVVAAIPRMLDGAELLVLARAMTDTAVGLLTSKGVAVAEAFSVVMNAMTAAAAIWSLVVVTAFVLMSGYFGSERLRDVLTRSESAPPT